MSSYVYRALTVCAVLTICLLAFSCGGGKHSGSGITTNPASCAGLIDWNGRHVKPLRELLDELDSLKMPSGVNPHEWAALKSDMRSWLNETFGEDKSTSKYPQQGPPTPEYVKARELTWAQEEGNTWGKLTWRYVNDGDYNQDGVVSPSDASILAMHLGEAVTEGNTIQELIDEDDEGGSSNGDLVVDAYPPYQSGNKNDEETLFLNFGVDVASYEILGSSDGTTWVPEVGEVDFSEGTGKADGRAVFEWSIPSGDYQYYKVVARSFDDEPWHYDRLRTQVVESSVFTMPAPYITDVNPKSCHPATSTHFTASVSGFPGSPSYQWDFGAYATPRLSGAVEPDITFQNRGFDYTATGHLVI